MLEDLIGRAEASTLNGRPWLEGDETLLVASSSQAAPQNDAPGLLRQVDVSVLLLMAKCCKLYKPSISLTILWLFYAAEITISRFHCLPIFFCWIEVSCNFCVQYSTATPPALLARLPRRYWMQSGNSAIALQTPRPGAKQQLAVSTVLWWPVPGSMTW